MTNLDEALGAPYGLVRKGAAMSTVGYAGFSDDKVYRYWLTRCWELNVASMIFVMLNPSTADAEVSDPTVTRCMGFARREGFGGILVMNLFALRSTNPAALKKHSDPRGPQNSINLDRALLTAKTFNMPVVCAWGAHPFARAPGDEFCKMAAFRGVDLKCLSMTKGGFPRHPLYLRADQKMESFA